MSMIYLFGCLLIAVGSFMATYTFAKKDWPIYAVFFFFIGSSAFGSATTVVLKDAAPVAGVQERVEAK